jgi:LCP family protein required for cell wall assembly
MKGVRTVAPDWDDHKWDEEEEEDELGEDEPVQQGPFDQGEGESESEELDLGSSEPDTAGEPELDPEFKQELEGNLEFEDDTEEEGEPEAFPRDPFTSENLEPAPFEPESIATDGPLGGGLDTEEHSVFEEEEEEEEELEAGEPEPAWEQPAGEGDGQRQPATAVAVAPAGLALSPAQGGMPAGMQPPPEFVPQADAPDERPPRSHLFRRFLAAAFLVVAAFAAATSISLLNYLSDIASALGHGAALTGVRQQLQSVDGGTPQTILIIGSDERYGEKQRGRSDTTILLRLDPNRDAISLLSIPRDLKVKIPGHGTDKFNAAFADGGPNLTLKVVKNLTGIHVNHLVNVDFSGFFYAINAIGCVFVDVDHRYFHSNAGLPPALQYSEINIQPGYQRLCGKNALQYVRYRHQDNDLVRSARQHDFLREARQKVGPSKLIGDRKQLIRIFTRYTSSDIDDPETMLEVLKLFLASRGAAIKEVHFPADLGKSYVTAKPPAIAGAVRQFLGITGSANPRGNLEEPLASSKEPGQGGKQGKKKSKGRKGKRRKNALPTSTTLFNASTAGEEQAFYAKNRLRFPVFYPTLLKRGTIYAQKPHVYKILHADNDKSYPAYRMVMRTNFGEYYGVMGTTWKKPPILRSPSETRRYAGRTYLLYFDNDRLRMVAWKSRGATYWLNNTLLQSLSEKEMLGIATTMGSTRARRR